MTHGKLSVIVPIFNERENVAPLFFELERVLLKIRKDKIIKDFETIFVDDGSTDGSREEILNLVGRERKLKAIFLRKNFGQTAALSAGFDNSSGDLVVTMDGDLQNDPRDIPRLIGKLDEGYDAVSGWRFNRRDKVMKRIFSRMMNNLRMNLIGDRLHDYGCSLKIYKKECIQDLELFGELHRYITAYLYIKGYRIGEIKVNHRTRRAGATKYRLNRGINGILDLFFLKFWSSYSNRPLHFFGRLGIYQWALAVLVVIEQIVKAYIVQILAFGPLLALASMLVITGLITIIFGFLSEMTARNYLRERKIYSIREAI